MTRMFTKIIALTWLVIAIVALIRDSRSYPAPQPTAISADTPGSRGLTSSK